MKHNINICLTYLILLLCILTAGASAPFYFEIREGNKAFTEKDLKEAEKHYLDALEKNPASGIGYYNLGNVYYRQGDFLKAAEKYNQSLQDRNLSNSADAYFNMGNSNLMTALQALNSQDEQQKQLTGKFLQTAADSYKTALAINPDDNESRYNLEYALKLMKSQNVEQQQSEQDKSNQCQDKKEEAGQQQQQEKQEQQSSSEEKQDSGDNKEEQQQQQSSGSQKEEEDQEEQQSAGQPPQEEESEEKEAQAAKGEEEKEPPENKDDTDGLSVSEANTLLNIVSQQEKEALKNRKRTSEVKGYSKDW